MFRPIETAVAPAVAPTRLARGSHDSPDEGACAMELASMLAGEPFGDRPRCVCPVIGAFVRTLNDGLGYAARQELISYVPLLVGTASGEEVRRRREEMCLAYGAAAAAPAGPRARLAIWLEAGMGPALRLSEGAGTFAARRALRRRDIEGAFGLLREMAALGSESPALAGPVVRLPELGVARRIEELPPHPNGAHGNEARQNGGRGGGAHDLARREAGEREEERVHDEQPGDRRPERELQPV